MALPLLETPDYPAIIPSTSEEIRFRPFLVKEEKILYMALEGNDDAEIAHAINTLLKACILTPGIDVDKLASFDVEYLFLMLRAKSVGEELHLKLKHINSNDPCDHYSDVEVSLDDIQPPKPSVDKRLMLTDHIGIELRFPSLMTLRKAAAKHSDFDKAYTLLTESINYIFDAEGVYNDYSPEELKTFVDSLTQNQFGALMNFFNNLPKLTHTIEWNCEKCNQKTTATVEGLRNFFV